MNDILRTHLLSRFTCLGDKCEDTCCQGWSMQMDESTLTRYREEAPELLDAVEPSQDAPWIMRKDPTTGFCVRLEGGMCNIHKSHGERFLGDACHFYPRATRKLGDKVIMTATMSCPEVARLALDDAQACAHEAAQVDRLPHTLKDYLPEGLSSEEAFLVHEAFIAATKDEAVPAEQIFLRIASASRSLERIDRKSWPQMASFYIANADMRIPKAETELSDPFNLLHALCGLVVASKKKPSQRLSQTISDMERSLVVSLDWDSVTIRTADNSLSAYQEMQRQWRDTYAPMYDTVLKRWLAMQLSLSLYPFAGLGSNATERVTLIGVRLATIKLALMSNCSIFGTQLPQDVVIRLLQSLSRFLDHLGDPGFSLQIYGETGWTRESRMRGLLES